MALLGNIYRTITDGSNVPIEGVVVIARLQPLTGAIRIDDMSEVAGEVRTTTDVNGTYGFDLELNANITPANTYWEIEERIPRSKGGTLTWAITVPPGSSDISSIGISTVSDLRPEVPLTVTAGDFRYARFGTVVAGAGAYNAVVSTIAQRNTIVAPFDGYTVLVLGINRWYWWNSSRWVASDEADGFNPLDFGALDSLIFNSTTAIQLATDAAIAAGSGSAVCFSAGEWLSGMIDVEDALSITIYSRGSAAIYWTGTGADINHNPIAFVFRGNCYNTVVKDLTMIGDGTASSYHCGVIAETGSYLERCGVERCRIREIRVGVQLCGDNYGSALGGFARNNHIYHAHGTLSGSGYGIINSGGYDMEITGNFIERCERHSIYQAAGSKVLIAGNHIKDHRIDVADRTFREAIPIARSQHVTCVDNIFDNCYDGCIGVDADSVAGPNTREADNIIINHNMFYNPQYYAVRINNNALPPTVSETKNISIKNNHTFSALPAALSNWFFRVGGAIDVDIDGNKFTVKNHVAEIDCIILDALGDSGGTATYNGLWRVKNNTCHANPSGGGATALISLTSNTATSIVDIEFDGNREYGCDSLIGASGVTNPNITIGNQPYSPNLGWNSSADGPRPKEFNNIMVKGDSLNHAEGYIVWDDTAGHQWRMGQNFAAGKLSIRDVGTGREVIRFDASPADGEMGAYLLRNKAGVYSLQRVTEGAADSGGAGFRVLRVPN